ncbi:30S ribosomal protein S21 domain protein [Trichostrongylus colubriformis]|uniref:30S ribosomal protein S21 domain protein n=1 Tax=Trichostrongylus colubriformis TaxID=6319 RepID=A0AAN8IKW8_TRICO
MVSLNLKTSQSHHKPFSAQKIGDEMVEETFKRRCSLEVRRFKKFCSPNKEMKIVVTCFVVVLLLLFVEGEISSTTELEFMAPPTSSISLVKDDTKIQSNRSVLEDLYTHGAARELRVKRQWRWRRVQSRRCGRSIREKRQFFNPFFGLGGFGGFGGGCCCCCCCMMYGKK